VTLWLLHIVWRVAKAVRRCIGVGLLAGYRPDGLFLTPFLGSFALAYAISKVEMLIDPLDRGL
jgi:hypothetical protein